MKGKTTLALVLLVGCLIFFLQQGWATSMDQARENGELFATGKRDEVDSTMPTEENQLSSENIPQYSQQTVDEGKEGELYKNPDSIGDKALIELSTNENGQYLENSAITRPKWEIYRDDPIITGTTEIIENQEGTCTYEFVCDEGTEEEDCYRLYELDSTPTCITTRNYGERKCTVVAPLQVEIGPNDVDRVKLILLQGDCSNNDTFTLCAYAYGMCGCGTAEGEWGTNVCPSDDPNNFVCPNQPVCKQVSPTNTSTFLTTLYPNWDEECRKEDIYYRLIVDEPDCISSGDPSCQGTITLELDARGYYEGTGTAMGSYSPRMCVWTGEDDESNCQVYINDDACTIASRECNEDTCKNLNCGTLCGCFSYLDTYACYKLIEDTCGTGPEDGVCTQTSYQCNDGEIVENTCTVDRTYKSRECRMTGPPSATASDPENSESFVELYIPSDSCPNADGEFFLCATAQGNDGNCDESQPVCAWVSETSTEVFFATLNPKHDGNCKTVDIYYTLEVTDKECVTSGEPACTLPIRLGLHVTGAWEKTVHATGHYQPAMCVWDDVDESNCPYASDTHCTLITQECAEGSDECRDLDCGTLCGCYSYERTYNCSQAEPADGNICETYQINYHCDARCNRGHWEVVSCDTDVYCAGEFCFPQQEPEADNKSFAEAATFIQITKKMALENPKTPKIFEGKSYKCKKILGGVAADCCNFSGILEGWLIGCSESERELAEKHENGKCHYVGTWCCTKALFVCLAKCKRYCCFHSKLARIIHEQGRGQLGDTINPGCHLIPDPDNPGYFMSSKECWGSPENPNCQGLKPEDLERINFEQIDFSEYYSDLIYKEIDQTKTMDTAQDKFEKYYNQHQGN